MTKSNKIQCASFGGNIYTPEQLLSFIYTPICKIGVGQNEVVVVKNTCFNAT